MFDFQNAQINQGPTNIQPGIQTVKIESITNGLSEVKQSPYLEFKIVDDNGAKLSQRYSLQTTISEGKQKSAWEITRNAILSIVAACLNLDETSAKAKMPNATSAEDLAMKLSALCAGKAIRIVIVGEEKISNAGRKYMATSFPSGGLFVESASIPVSESKLKFSEEKNIKRLPTNTGAGDISF